MAVNLNFQFESLRAKQIEVMEKPDKRDGSPLKNVSMKSRNLKELTGPFEVKRAAPHGFIHPGYIVRNGLAEKRNISQSKIMEIMKLIETFEVTEEQLKKEFEQFKEYLIECLADISDTGVELNQVTMPQRLGGRQEPVCPELENVLETAKKMIKVRMCINRKEKTPLDYKRLLKVRTEIDGYLPKLVLEVAVVFKTFRSENLAIQPDPAFVDVIIPEYVNISKLLGKRHGDTIKNVLDGRNLLVKFEEMKDSCEMEPIMVQLLKPMIRDLLKKVETYNPLVTVSAPEATAQLLLQSIAHTLGPAVWQELLNMCKPIGWQEALRMNPQVLLIKPRALSLSSSQPSPGAYEEPVRDRREIRESRNADEKPQRRQRPKSLTLNTNADVINHNLISKEAPQ